MTPIQSMLENVTVLLVLVMSAMTRWSPVELNGIVFLINRLLFWDLFGDCVYGYVLCACVCLSLCMPGVLDAASFLFIPLIKVVHSGECAGGG